MIKVNFDLEENEELSRKVNCTLLLAGEEIGCSEMYLIDGGEKLVEYLEQAEHYSPWVPYDAMQSINFEGETGISKNIGYIHNIFINENSRGHGYARFFLKKIEGFAKNNGIKTMILQPCLVEKFNTEFYLISIDDLTTFFELVGYQLYETERTMRSAYYYKEI